MVGKWKKEMLDHFEIHVILGRLFIKIITIRRIWWIWGRSIFACRQYVIDELNKISKNCQVQLVELDMMRVFQPRIEGLEEG